MLNLHYAPVQTSLFHAHLNYFNIKVQMTLKNSANAEHENSSNEQKYSSNEQKNCAND